MKKSLILAGMLCIGYANAQYDGKVGINTNEPKATLDVNAETTNLNGTTNEGIIAPKLSKTRIANIEASKLTEGTLVYATDAVYTGTEARVSKIDEKGYYFYNGAEWVKVQYQDTNTNDAEWVYDDSTKRINLKRSAGSLFENNVFYNQKGALQRYNTTSYKYTNVNTGAVMTDSFDPDSTLANYNATKTSSLDFGSSTSYQQNRDLVYVDNTTSANMSIMARSSDIYVSPENTKNYNLVRAARHSATHYGTGNVKYLVGGYYDARLEGGGSSDGYVAGVRATALYSTKKTSAEQDGIVIFNSADKSAGGTIGNMVDVNAYKSFANTSPLAVTNLKGIYVKNNFSAATGKVSITNARGFDYVGLDLTNSTHEVKDNYGLYVGKIAGGTNSNYAVYTNEGKVRVGDLADTAATGNRQVVVDADGVLKAGDATTGATTLSGTKDLACNDANRGKMNFVKDVTIGTGKGDAFAVCLKGTDGKFYWRYLYGAAGVTNKEGDFGAGL